MILILLQCIQAIYPGIYRDLYKMYPLLVQLLAPPQPLPSHDCTTQILPICIIENQKADSQ